MATTCSKCGQPFAVVGRYGTKSWCKPCHKENAAARRKENRAHGLCHCGVAPETGYKLCAKHRAALRTTYRTKHAVDPVWMAKRIARSKTEALELKRAAFAAYGDACACCGEARVEFLSIDHIDPATVKRGTYGRSGVGLYRMLKRAGYPAGFRVLCMNCNFARGQFGYCPHERETSGLVEVRRAG